MLRFRVKQTFQEGLREMPVPYPFDA